MSKFHFIKNKKVTLTIIAIVLVVGLASFFIRGFNIDIDFAGGTEIKVDLGVEVTDDVRSKLEDICNNEFSLKILNEESEDDKAKEAEGDKSESEAEDNYYHEPLKISSIEQSEANSNMVIIRTSNTIDNLNEDRLKEFIILKFPATNVDNFESNSIAPTIGDSLTRKAILAVSIAVILMLAYIWFRFELTSGIAAVACLTHDLFVMLTIYSLFQIPINSNIIAAFLTILGYSINATIIVFDRVRENKKLDGGKSEFGEVVNGAVHDTLARSINTTITTLLTIGMIYLLGVDTIKDFALPLIIGIVAGLFSSVFVSGMLWESLNKVIKPKAEKKAK